MNIAIIGCGAIAKGRHIPGVSEDARANLYKVCDPVKANADAMAEQYHTQACYDIREILDDPEVDAVIICTPERFHCDNIIRSLESGKDVLVEKPLAMNIEEGREIIKAWENSGKRLLVAFAQRLNNEHILAKKLLKEGVIGKPIAFRTALAHKGAEYATSAPLEADFYDKRLKGIGDVMLSVGCHRIDLMSYLFETPIESVSAINSTIDKKYADGSLIQAADHTMINVTMKNGPVGSFWISWCDYGETERGTMIYGTEGTMSISEAPGIVVRKADGSKVEYTVAPDTNSWRKITHHFIDVLSGEAEAAADGYDGLRCLLAMEAVELSAGTGEVKKVEEI